MSTSAYPASRSKEDSTEIATIVNYKSVSSSFVMAIVLSTLLYVIVVMHVPVVLLANEGHDDAHFVAQGISIFSGHWLGPFDQMTLCKGPGYPIFLAFNAVLGLPITLTQAILYSFACAVMAITILQLEIGPVFALLAFVTMQWHPAVFPYHIVRDDLSPPQILLILACTIRIVFVCRSVRNCLAWGIGGGLVLGWFWMTREDGIWIAPALILLVATQAFRVRRSIYALSRLVAGVGAVLTTALITLGIVASINLAVYGTFVITDFKALPFARALNILQTVRVGEVVPYVPVPHKVRSALDKVSPAFASLEPFLNGEGQVWTHAGCAIYPSTCRDFAGGWFMWVFRDAVAATGHYSSPHAAAAFYNQLYNEVHAACLQGKLECRRNPLPFMPAMRLDQWSALPIAIMRMYALATEREPGVIWTTSQRLNIWSEGSRDQLHVMEDFLRYPRRTLAPSDHFGIAISGWYHGGGDEWLSLECSSHGKSTTVALPRSLSPDLVQFFHNPAANDQRFYLSVPLASDCSLQVTPAHGSPMQLWLSDMALGQSDFGGGTLGIDRIDYKSYLLHGTFAAKVLVIVTQLYSWCLSFLTVVATVALFLSIVWAMIRRNQVLTSNIMVISTIGILLLTRATVLVLVHISSFPGIVPLYWGAGFPLLCLAIILTLRLPLNFRPPRLAT